MPSHNKASGIINGLTFVALIILLCINLPLHAIAVAILYHTMRMVD